MKRLRCVVVVLVCCMMTGCGTYLGMSERLEGAQTGVYEPTVFESVIGYGLLTDWQVGAWSPVIGSLLFLDVPLTATTDTLCLPWDATVALTR